MQYNLKSIKQHFKDNGVFYTPPELAKQLMDLIDIEIQDVYEPTCGEGGLLEFFPDELPKYGQELDAERLEVAKGRIPNLTGAVGNVLSNPSFMDKRFSCIIANPPFSVKWEQIPDDIRFKDAPCLAPKSKADYAFLLHILHLLKDDGIAIVLNGCGILYRGASEGKIRKWIIENNWIEKVVLIPANSFVDTKIPTVALVLKKNKKSTDIEFVDKSTGKSRIVTLDEVAKKDFNLSGNLYFESDIKPISESVNIADLNNDLRNSQIKSLNLALDNEKMLCELGLSDRDKFTSLLDDLKSVIESYY